MRRLAILAVCLLAPPAAARAAGGGFLAEPTDQLAVPGLVAGAEITPEGDVYTGSAELRFDQKTNLQYLSGYQLYAFVDSGVAWNDGYRLSDGLSLTSAGGGVRFRAAHRRGEECDVLLCQI